MSGTHDEPLLECRGVVKRFHAYEHRTTSLQEFFTQRFLRNAAPVPVPRFHLSGIDIAVHRDESVALIGANGSGKSTVLRIMAGILPPTEGRVIQHGRVVPIIELGATFQPSLTGEENVALYAAALGLMRRDVLQHMDGIFEFAGIEEFRHVPLKYYSSGMRARLAFSIASRVRADVLLLDEILAVGDAEFKERCVARLAAFRDAGRSLVVVSHDLSQVRELCTRAVWLEHGRIRDMGPVDQITEAYESTALAGI